MNESMLLPSISIVIAAKCALDSDSFISLSRTLAG